MTQKSEAKALVVQPANSVQTQAQTATKPSQDSVVDTSISNNKNSEQSVQTLTAANPPPASQLADNQPVNSASTPAFQRQRNLILFLLIADLFTTITDHSASALGSTVSDSGKSWRSFARWFFSESRTRQSALMSRSEQREATRLYTGTVTINAASASLSLGTAFSATLTNLSGSYSLTSKSASTGGNVQPDGCANFFDRSRAAFIGQLEFSSFLRPEWIGRPTDCQPCNFLRFTDPV